MADVTSLSALPRGPHPVGLHSEYAVAGSNEIINIFVPYHDSETVQTFEISANFIPTVHYERVDDRSLVERDICAFITDCAGGAYSSAAVFAAVAKQTTVDSCASIANSVNDYLTQGNYAVAKQVIVGGTVVGIVVNLVSSVPNYFINVKLEATYGSSDTRNDVCGEQDPKTFSSNAASAVYEFCLSIKNELAEQATANFDVLDTVNGLNSPTGGFEGRAKMFISDQAATWGDICRNDYGVDWKHRIRRALGGIIGSGLAA
ncbi:hypothetical protein F4782DRAFT_533038 [Xylaria castorea]|nr:hypothetical protein F4782DRAFT_533038 [Xylaria castorea]